MIVIDKHSKVTLQSGPSSPGVGLSIVRHAMTQHILWFADRETARAVLEQAIRALNDEQRDAAEDAA